MLETELEGQGREAGMGQPVMTVVAGLEAEVVQLVFCL